MDAPSLTAAASTAGIHTDSADSSPRSRHNDSWHADPPPEQKLRLMCSYGGHIVPRPHDKTLRYIGGDTRIIVIDRQISLSELHGRLSRSLLHNQPFSLKYRLPGEDLDSLISVSTDEDLENMAEEYDRLSNGGGGEKRGRLRLFLFPKSPSGAEQVLLETSSAKSEDWFFDAVNVKASLSAAASDNGYSETSSVNCLLGLDDDLVGKAAVKEKDVEAQTDGAKIEGSGNENGSSNGNGAINHDVHSIPDSPMLGTTSSFGSTSSSPSVPNIPPTGAHAEENLKAGGMGIEEQFQQMGVAVGGNANLPPPPQKQEEVGGLSAAVITAGTVVSGLSVVVGGEYVNQVLSDDERSDNGGYKKVQPIQPQVQPQLQPQQIPQIPQKQTTAFDISSPDSISSEGNAKSPWSKQAVYQEQLKQIQPGNTTSSSNQADPKPGDQNTSNMVQESGYMPSGQCDQNHPWSHQPQHFIPPGSPYIPAGAVPILPYYPMYPPQQQTHPQPYPIYIWPGNQSQPYSTPVQQPSYSEIAPATPSTCSQTPPAAMASHPALSKGTNVPSSKPEMFGGIYQTVAPQLVQVPSGQHQVQYVAFTPFPHTPQSVAPSSATNSAYDFTDPAHLQMYCRPLPPHLAPQYQPFTPPSAMIIPDTSAQHTLDNIKQQTRTQP